MRTRIIFILVLFFMCSTFIPQSNAQIAIGPHILISIPQDNFSNFSDTGEGLGVKFAYTLTSIPILSARVDLEYLSYGVKPAAYYYNVGTISTRNEAFRLVAGPELAAEFGRFKIYGEAMGGVYAYRTVVSVTDYIYTGTIYGETTMSRTKFGWNAGGGVLVDIGIGPWIDIGAKYHNINDVIYATVDEEEISSDAQDVTINIGVVFFID